MRAVLVCALGLLLAGTAGLEAGGPKVRGDTFGNVNPGWTGRGLDPRPPPRVPRARVAPQRPVIACDVYGRCWQHVPGYRSKRYGHGSYRYNGYEAPAPFGARPPGWAYDLPYRAQAPDRFIRPQGNVVCDRSSRICYKRGEIDKSETRTYFGERAADRADDLRDRRGTARLFVPERGITCDRQRQVCYDDGVADHGLTRRYFGRRAAGSID